jgi:hypothetical protein
MTARIAAWSAAGKRCQRARASVIAAVCIAPPLYGVPAPAESNTDCARNHVTQSSGLHPVEATKKPVAPCATGPTTIHTALTHRRPHGPGPPPDRADTAEAAVNTVHIREVTGSSPLSPICPHGQAPPHGRADSSPPYSPHGPRPPAPPWRSRHKRRGTKNEF